MKRKTLLRTLGPGILVAATGVGAGDLATASFSGNLLGLTILWVVLFTLRLRLEKTRDDLDALALDVEVHLDAMEAPAQ